MSGASCQWIYIFAFYEEKYQCVFIHQWKRLELRYANRSVSYCSVYLFHLAEKSFSSYFLTALLMDFLGVSLLQISALSSVERVKNI